MGLLWSVWSPVAAAFSWLEQKSAVVMALATVGNLLVTAAVVVWAQVQAVAQRKQARAAEGALNEMREERWAAVRPIIVPFGAPQLQEPGRVLTHSPFGRAGECLQVDNCGPGPALDVLVRLWDGSARTLFETLIGLVPPKSDRTEVVRSRTGGQLCTPAEDYGTLLEVVYLDVFNRQYRTIGRWDDQRRQWVDIELDGNGSRERGRLLVGTKYVP